MPNSKSDSFLKVDDELRLVIGWASVNKINGDHVVDSQDDVISSRELTKAAMDFMSVSRMGGVMHFKNANDEVIKAGEVVFALPFTDDIKKVFGIEIPEEGLAIGVRIDDDGVWKMVKDGTLAAFSIGGNADRVEIEDV